MRKSRRRREIPFEHFRLFTFGSDVELVESFGSLEEAERVWQLVRHEFLGRWDLWGRPAAWWRFEPGVPSHLRSGPHAIITSADAEEWDRIEQGRRRYLVSIGIDPAPQRRHQPFGTA